MAICEIKILASSFVLKKEYERMNGLEFKQNTCLENFFHRESKFGLDEEASDDLDEVVHDRPLRNFGESGCLLMEISTNLDARGVNTDKENEENVNATDIGMIPN